MPSLRRTISSPSVRSSPYRALSSPLSSGLAQRNNGHGFRRSSGSDTTTRRVLADIEWWRIVAGQRDFEADQTLDHFMGQTLAIRTEPAPESPLIADEGGFAETADIPPTNAFAALSITSHPSRRRPYHRQSSTSSSESSFEICSCEGLCFTVPGEDSSCPGPFLPDFPVLNDEQVDEWGITPFFAVHSHSFNDFATVSIKTATHLVDFEGSPICGFLSP